MESLVQLPSVPSLRPRGGSSGGRLRRGGCGGAPNGGRFRTWRAAVPAIRAVAKPIHAAAILAILSMAFVLRPSAARAQETPDWLRRAEIGGLMFGDYYWAANHHLDREAAGEDDEIEGANGFWIRRVYLTFDYRLDESFDFRLRFEGNSPGEFRDEESIVADVKDLWIRWNAGRHQVHLGITGTPTWGFIEDFWGYRDVEKTALDLHDFASSRDLGIGATGRLDEKGRFRYHVMLGNGAGTAAEVNEGKKLYGSLRYEHPSGFAVEVYGDYEERPDDGDTGTYQAFVGWRGEVGRIGVMAARQHRERGGAPDLDLELGSAFAVLELHERVSVLGRVDRMFDPNPGAAGIDYFVMSPREENTFLLAGVDVELVERVHLVPNVEAVFYDDSSTTPGPDSDVFLRTTFSATF